MRMVLMRVEGRVYFVQWHYVHRCEQEREGWNVDWSVGDYLLAVRDDIREEGGEEYD